MLADLISNKCKINSMKKKRYQMPHGNLALLKEIGQAIVKMKVV